MLDLLIVGCGPAGSSAAREARRLGLSVLVVDAKPFPRYKTCGGGLSARTLPLLPEGIRSVIEATIRRVRFEDKRDGFEIASDSPIAYMVMRDRFDAFLADAAASAGANIRLGETVFRAAETNNGVKIETDRGVIRARWGIGADGVEGVVRKHLFPRRSVRRAPAIEQERLSFLAPSSSSSDRITIDVLSLCGGYGWIFPKAAGVSAGVAVFRGRASGLRQALRRVLSRDGEAAEACREEIHGFPIPLFRDDGRSRSTARWLLAGDAADLVDPLFGEGIYYAVRSGILAARVIAESRGGSPLSRYDAVVDEILAPDLRAAGRLCEIVYRFPGWSLGMIRRHPEWIRLYFKVLQGSLSYGGMIAAARNDVLASVKAKALRRLLGGSASRSPRNP